MTLDVLADTYAVCKLKDTKGIELTGELMALTATTDEISLVCAEQKVPNGCVAERGWRALRIAGTLDFSLVGILAKIADVLANAGISLFVISTYDTDYILVKEQALPDAVAALKAKGYMFAAS